jgi:PAS domain S-box-containing protein
LGESLVGPDSARSDSAHVVERAQLEAVFMAMDDGVVVFDMAGNVVLLNEAEARICGYESAAEMKRDLAYFSTVFELVEDTGEILPVEQWPVSRVLRGESLSRVELGARRKDTGRTWRFSFSGEPVRDASGEQILAVVITRDVTELHAGREATRQADQRYRTLFESIDQGFCILQIVFDDEDRPLDYVFVEANEAFERHTGLRNAVGKTARHLVPELDASWFEMYGEVARTGIAKRFQNHAPAMNRWFEGYAFRVGDPQDRQIALLFSDVTQRVEAEAAVVESERFTRRVLDNLFAFVGVLELDGTVITTNLAPLEAAGITSDEVFGKKLWDCYWCDTPELQAEIRELCEAAAQGKTVRREVNVRMIGGTRAQVDLQIAPLRDENGNITHLIPSSVDISERVEAEAALKRSEERYRAIVEGQSEMVSRFTADGTLIFVNGAYARARGADPEALIGTNLWHSVAEKDRPSVQAMLDSITREHPVVRVENHFHTKDEVRWTLWTNRGLEFDESGKATEFQSVGIDITERKVAEEELARSEALVRTIAENSTQGLAMMDEQGYCTYANKAWLDMTGFTAEEIRSKPLHDLVHHHYPDGRPYPKDECPIDRALPENFDVRAHEDLFFRKDGSSFPVLCAASPVFRDNRPVATVIEIRDVTEAKRAKEALERSHQELELRVAERTAELEAAYREMESFNYSIAHDLRGPLRGIAANSAMLLEDAGHKLDEDEREYLRSQQRAAKKLSRLIDDILLLSRLGRQEFVRTDVDVSALAEEVLSEISSAYPRITFTIQEGLHAKGDPSSIKLLLHNLIGNACKYSPDGGRVIFGRTDDMDRPFFVKDEGIGFDMAYEKKLYTPFERLHREEEFPGSGIGLASVRRIVERHGGRVWAESSPGQGACFYFTLGA